MLLNELFTPQEKTEPKIDLVDDVLFFIANEDTLHKKYFLPAVQELKRKNVVERDEIDEIYPAFAKLVNAGCQAYYKKYKPQGKMEDVFSKEMRISIAKKLAEKQLPYIKDGEYDPKEA